MTSDNQISFSQEIKEELCNNEVSKVCALAILSSFIKNNGSFLFGKEERIEIKTENAKVSKYIYVLLRKVFNEVNVSFRYRVSMHFKKHYEYIIVINNEIDYILKSLELDFLSNKIPSKLISKEEGLRGYFIGIFLSSGSCSNPLTSNYHLEMSSKNEEFAKEILRITKKIKVYPFEFKFIQRRSSYVVYLKQSEAIASFLAFIDANNTALDFEGLRLERDENNNLNRIANLDMYNYKKMIEKSEEIINILNAYDKKYGIKNITDTKLKELCLLKRENPEVSYNDLAKLLSERLNMKISKSSVSRLINQIKEFKNKYDL